MAVIRLTQFSDQKDLQVPLAVKPYLGCNINCSYCFEHDWHRHGPEPGLLQRRDYDLDVILEQIGAMAQPRRHVALHGGEPTALPIRDAERIFEQIAASDALPGIQTNALRLTESWLSLFKKYGVHVGVSYDGPGRLNAARGYFNRDGERLAAASDRYSAIVDHNILRMREAGIAVSIITVLNRYNALPEPRRELKAWLMHLKGIGITGGRLNLAFVNDNRLKPRLELSSDEATECWLDLANFVLSDPELTWSPFRELVDNLFGLGVASCSFTGCDPANTRGEVVIGPNGTRLACSRLQTPAGAPVFLPPENVEPSPTRSRALHDIPFSEGGCGGCRYWSVCHGGCPAEGGMTDSGRPDYSAKSRFCPAIHATYAEIEQKLKSLMPNLRTVPDFTVDDTDWLEDKSRRERRQWDRQPWALMSARHAMAASSYASSSRLRPPASSASDDSEVFLVTASASHTDTHTDEAGEGGSHADLHNDRVLETEAEGGTHTNYHSDSHGDSHSDEPHNDHTDGGFHANFHPDFPNKLHNDFHTDFNNPFEEGRGKTGDRGRE